MCFYLTHLWAPRVGYPLGRCAREACAQAAVLVPQAWLLTLPGTPHPSCSGFSHSRMSGCRDPPFSAGLGAPSSNCTMDPGAPVFLVLIDWGGEREDSAFPCGTQAGVTPSTLCSRTACSREQLSLAGLPRIPSHPLLSLCCRSKNWNPYKDSPASNSGQERPGDLFPESPLTRTQKNKVTQSDMGLSGLWKCITTTVVGQGPCGWTSPVASSLKGSFLTLWEASTHTSSFPCLHVSVIWVWALIWPFCIFVKLAGSGNVTKSLWGARKEEKRLPPVSPED